MGISRKQTLFVRAVPDWRGKGEWRQAVAVDAGLEEGHAFGILLRLFKHEHGTPNVARELAIVRWLLRRGIDSGSGHLLLEVSDSVDVIPANTIVRPVGVIPVECLHNEEDETSRFYLLNRHMSRDMFMYCRKYGFGRFP